MVSISVNELLYWKKSQLSKGGDNQSLDYLLDSLGGLSIKELNLHKINFKEKIYLNKNLNQIESIWDLHLSESIPIQYLCGTVFWRDLKLEVTEKVLIPRSETEIIVDIVLKIFGKNLRKLIFAELGTGSGAISIALALANPLWEGIATDIDQGALKVAIKNYSNYSTQSNLKFFCGNWWTPLECFKGKLDLVVSNPPYIPKDTYEKLPAEVKNFEPKIALFGGEDGLDHIKEIIQKAPQFLSKEGWIILENHFDQGDKVKQLLNENGFLSVEIVNDYSGIGRFTIGRYK